MSTPLVIVRGAGSALVLTQDEGGALPHVVHWGTDLPDAVLGDLTHLTGAPVPHNQPDAAWQVSVLPTSGQGWLGTPALEVHRAGGRTAPRWVATLEGGDHDATVRATASDIGLDVVVRYRLDEHGVLTVETELTNTAAEIGRAHV